MKLKKASSILTRIIISAVLMFLLFYSMLPAINLRDRNFIIYLISCIVIFLVVNFLTYVRILSRISVPAGVWNSPEIL